MNGPRTAHCRSVVLALATTVAASSAAPPAIAPPPTAPPSAADSLAQEIASLRRQAHYAKAVHLARELRQVLGSTPDTRAWRIADVERLTNTLELAATLPADDRLKLAGADRATARIDSHYARGQFAEAAALAEDQLLTRRRLLGDDHPDIAASLISLAAAERKLGNYTRGETRGREALAIYRRLVGEVHPDVARSQNLLGLLLMLQGEFDEAEHLFRQALAMYRDLFGDEHESIVDCLGNLGAVRQQKRDYVGAEPFFRAALDMTMKLGHTEDLKLAHALHDLGFVLLAESDYARAEDIFGDALALRRALLGDEHPDVALTLQLLAQSVRCQDDIDTALGLAREALTIRRRVLGDKHQWVAWNLGTVANITRLAGRVEEAEGYAREALAIHREVLGESHPDFVRGLGQLASFLATAGKLKEAEQVYRETIERQHEVFGTDSYMLHRDLGAVLIAEERFSAAERTLSRSATVLESELPRLGPAQARAAILEKSPYGYLAASRLELGNEAGAWSATEHERGRALADLLLASGARTLATHEAAREDSLRNELGKLERQWAALRQGDRDAASAKNAPKLEETRRRLLEAEAEWDRFRREVARRHPVTEGGAFSLRRVQSVLPNRTAIVGWLDVEPCEKYRASWGYVLRSGSLDWTRLHPTPRNEGDSPSASRAEHFRRSLRFAASWPERVAPGHRDSAEARELWEERVAPLLPHLGGVTDLVIIPSGEMLGVPVEALIDSMGVYVGNRFAVSYAPSATIYTWLCEQRGTGKPHPPKGALLVGDPIFSGNPAGSRSPEGELNTPATPGANCSENSTAHHTSSRIDSLLRCRAERTRPRELTTLPRLPGTRTEVARVAASIPYATLLLGAQASEKELLRLADSGALRSFDLIHLATHTLVDDGHPERSAIILSQVEPPDPLAETSGGRICDGLLNVREVIRDLRIEAELVTLSGCQSALGKARRGEGYVGLAHAFLRAGARSLVVSLWDVDDAGTSLLMRRFYENLSGSYGDVRAGSRSVAMSKVEALREAKQWLRGYADSNGHHPFAHPATWSAFILIGDPM